MSLSDEIRARRQHAEWVRFEQGKGPKGETPPPPAYKDCRNCTLRDDYDELPERVAFCAAQCPYAALPPGPSKWYLACSLWAAMPSEFLVRYADDLGWKRVMDVQHMKESREAEKMAAMMGSKLIG